MKLSRLVVVITEIVFDALVCVAMVVIVSGHRWLDVTLWVVALIGIVGAIWLESKRRRLGRLRE